MSNFDPALSSGELDRRVERLSREYGIDAYQLYDWAWRHEKLVDTAPDGGVAPVWTDLFGRPIAWSAITEYVAAMHRYGAAAMAYTMIYAAREGYAERWPISPGWGIFALSGAKEQLHVEFPNGVFLWFFDPLNAGWQAWEIGEYARAVDLAGFDGVHIDQLGPRFEAVYLADGTKVDLAARFAPYLEEVRRVLLRARPDRSACTFNIVDGAVGEFATREVAQSDACAFLYSEIWFKTNTYDELRRYAEYLRGLGRGRAAVFAAYSQLGEEVGEIHEAESGTILRGVRVAADHPGFTGTGYVVGPDTAGASITWPIDLAAGQNVAFVFRVASASDRIARRHVSVDGARVGDVTFRASNQPGAWFSDAYVTASLGPGHHEVELSSQTGDEGAIEVDHLTLGQFSEPAVRLTDAVMFASGVTHIEIGDDLAGLAHEYFPNTSKSISPALAAALRRYYAFAAAYENLLFDPEVSPVDPETKPLEVLSGQRLDDHGGGVIHPILRRGPGVDIVHLVNLVGVDDDQWRNAAPAPVPQVDVRIRYRLLPHARVTGVSLASPDLRGGQPSPPVYTTREDPTGTFVEATIPRLEYWDMVVIRTEVP